MDYKKAGVNIEEGYRAVEKYRDLAASTSNSAVLNGIGSFAGMFSLRELHKILADPRLNNAANSSMDDPILVAGTDGVGTKLDIAFRLKKYDTVGIDCVAMCVNDILCHGALPLFFLDYLACGKLDASIAAEETDEPTDVAGCSCHVASGEAIIDETASVARETADVIPSRDTLRGNVHAEILDGRGCALHKSEQTHVILTASGDR